MKKVLIWLLIIGLLGFALFLLFPIIVLVLIGWMASANPEQLRSPVEQDLDFVNSKLEYLYYVNDKHSDGYNLYIGSIDGKTNHLISKNIDSIAYYYNYNKDKITFITDKKNNIKSYIKVYDLKNKKIEDTFEIDRQRYNGNFGAPQFSPDNTKLLYTISDKNYHDYVFIINLVDKSNKMTFNTEYEMYGDARWDINNTDIWMYRYSYRDHKEHYFKINPLKSTTQAILYTNFDEVSMAKIFGLKTNCWTKTTPFENKNDSEFVLKDSGRVLIKYHPGVGIDSTFNINDFDYTKDMQYLLFTVANKIYICDIKTGKIGYLADGHYPRLVGENSSINKSIKSFYDLGY